MLKFLPQKPTWVTDLAMIAVVVLGWWGIEVLVAHIC